MSQIVWTLPPPLQLQSQLTAVNYVAADTYLQHKVSLFTYNQAAAFNVN